MQDSTSSREPKTNPPPPPTLSYTCGSRNNRRRKNRHARLRYTVEDHHQNAHSTKLRAAKHVHRVPTLSAMTLGSWTSMRALRIDLFPYVATTVTLFINTAFITSCQPHKLRSRRPTFVYIIVGKGQRSGDGRRAHGGGRMCVLVKTHATVVGVGDQYPRILTRPRRS